MLFSSASAKVILSRRTPKLSTAIPSSKNSGSCYRSRVPFFSLRPISGMASQSSKSSIYDFTVKDARGSDVDLSTYKGKALLIVNVASQCGLTNSNYTELSQVYDKYKNQGLEILAFPCNQFGGQEPGNNEQIVEFACTRFKAEYPIFDKVDVNGENAAPLYKFLKSSKGGFLGTASNGTSPSSLLTREGQVVDRYAPTTSPLSIEKDIKKVLESLPKYLFAVGLLQVRERNQSNKLDYILS